MLVNGREAADGEVIVRYRAGTARHQRERLERQADAGETEPISRLGAHRIRSRRLGTLDLIQALQADPEVEFAEPNYVLSVTATPNEPWFVSLWGLLNSGQLISGTTGIPGADIAATQAWDLSTGSRSHVIGVIDTGIDYTHPDLAANMWRAPRAFSVVVGGVVITCAAGTYGFNAITNTCNPFDDQYHGTHVAGTIGAVGNNGIGIAGVNWTASLMALKFLSSTGSGFTSDAIKAIDFAIQVKAALGVDANVRILSNSWGGGGFSQALQQQINAANAHDILFVAAAGNSARDTDVTPFYPAAYATPNMISVAATTNLDQLASFSNWGLNSVHLGAPGQAVFSTLPNGQYGYSSGTSMATPHVAGAAALLLSHCALNTAALKSAILAAADPIVALAGRSTTGGRLNVDNAIRVCPTSVNPVPTVTAISPSSVYAGTTPAPTITLSGSGFLPGSVVSLDGVAQPATFVSPTTLRIPLSAGDIAAVTSHTLTVMNGAPGGGTSEGVVLNVVTPPALIAAPATVLPGGTLSVNVSGGPGNLRDWIGVFCPSMNGDTQYVDWKYLNGTKTAPPSGTSSASVNFQIPPAASQCNARFFLDDGFTRVATSNRIDVINAVPTLTSVTPNVLPLGHAGVVAVTGANFVAGALIHVDGVARGTTFVSATRLDMWVGAADLAGASSNRLVTVWNPAPGGGVSNALPLAIVGAAATLTPGATTAQPLSTTTVTVAGGPGNRLDWVGWFCPAANGDAAYSDWKYLSNSRVAPAAGLTSATITFTAPAQGGTACNARLFADNGALKIATSATVTVASVAPAIASVSPAAVPGSTIAFTVHNGPGNATDWVGWYCPATDADAAYLDWKYLNDTRTAPANGVSSSTITFIVRAGGGGACEARLFASNGFTKLADTSVTAIDASGITLTLTPTAVAPGGAVRVQAVLGSPMPVHTHDWVGLFCPMANGDTAYVDWKFMNNLKTAPAVGWSSPATLTFTAPGAIGMKCDARLFRANAFDRVITSWPATVTATIHSATLPR